MECRKTVLMNLFAGQLWRYKHTEQTSGPGGWGGEEKSGMNGESSMETYTLPYVKQITSGNLLYDSGKSNWGSMTT